MIITFKLYHRENGYKCIVNNDELLFLFGITEKDAKTINSLLQQNGENYYIQEVKKHE